MAAPRWLGPLLLVAFVPASSVLGLARPMWDDEAGGGWRLFADVWQANFWGDATFTLGTLGAGWAVARMVAAGMRDPKGAGLLLAVPASFLLHWLVYALSWSSTGPADESFWAWTFDGDTFRDSWRFTWDWGWPGLAFTAVAGPVGGWLSLRAPSPEAKAPPAPA